MSSALRRGFFFAHLVLVASLNSTRDETTDILYNIQPTGIDCLDNDSELCAAARCQVDVISRNSKVLNFGCNFTSPLDDFYLQVVYYYKFGVVYRKYLVDYTINICAAMDGRKDVVGEKQDKVIQTLISSYMRSNLRNLIHPCPYFGPHYIANFTTEELLGQTMIPEGDYRVEYRYFVGKTNKTLNHYRIYYSVKAKNPLLDMRLG